MKGLIDLTPPLGPDAARYPGDPPPRTHLQSSIAGGDALTASVLSMGVHTGAHVDLPAHFIRDGARLGDFPVAAFIGPAHVLDLTDAGGCVSAERLMRERIPHDRHILLKTRNSAFVGAPGFRADFTWLTPAAVAHLLESAPRSIGIDYYSLDPADSVDFPGHRLCAERDLPVYVCLDLSKAEAGDFMFAGLPIHYPALEGAPVRAVLWRP